MVDWGFLFFLELSGEGNNTDVLLEGIVVAVGSWSPSLKRKVYP